MKSFHSSKENSQDNLREQGPKTNNNPTQLFQDNRPEALAQLKLQEELQSKTGEVSQLVGAEEESSKLSGGAGQNNTGLPDNLKSGIERLSGLSMDDVQVHYNSEKPAQLNALAYAQGTDIYIGPGQEKHLAHEAWHVVQQKEGRVAQTTQLKGGVGINDEEGLEKEADVMGEKALGMGKGQAEGLENTQLKGKGAVQKVDAMEAFENVPQEMRGWYNSLFVPAATTIAAKAGQSFSQLIATWDKAKFLETLNELYSTVKQEPSSLMKSISSLFSSKPQGPVFVDSEAYPGMKRVEGTNIFVKADGNFDPQGKASASVLQFVNDYNSGNLYWYRGISISHFAWGALQSSGVLASEGTQDIPTFTMGQDLATRWLPGDTSADIPTGIASSISRDDAGLRALAEEMEIPIGAVLQFRVQSPTAVAFLNDGEQVVRGPIPAGSVTVHSLQTMGPKGIGSGMKGAAPTQLPPQAPYKAAKNSDAINAWKQSLGK